MIPAKVAPLLIALAGLALSSPDVFAEKIEKAANEVKERREMTPSERKAEDKRLREYDKPVEKDLIGNAIIGGGVAGALRGSAAAGASSVIKGSAVGVAKHQASKAEMERRSPVPAKPTAPSAAPKIPPPSISPSPIPAPTPAPVPVAAPAPGPASQSTPTAASGLRAGGGSEGSSRSEGAAGARDSSGGGFDIPSPSRSNTGDFGNPRSGGGGGGGGFQKDRRPRAVAKSPETKDQTRQAALIQGKPAFLSTKPTGASAPIPVPTR